MVRADDDYDVDNIKTVRTNSAPGPAAQGVRVEVIKGPDAGVTAQLARRVSVLGRSEAADFRLTDPTVSSFHVELSCTPYGVHVTDLESANGTLYAGARVERAIIPSGAMLNVGRSVIRIDVDVPFAPDASQLPAFGELRGGSVAMRELFSMLERLARTDLSILVEGPTGTGKELVARAVHDASPRKAGPLVVLDCTAIPATLAESTLFGHEKGAFTGASERRVGVFEAAEKGTIFLDEIGELALELQPKLLRVLERREVVRVGSTKPHPVNVRVIGATWRDLRAMINQGKFREDLYYRLAQARVTLPALRERPDDIPLLVQHFLAHLPRDVQCARAIAPDALEELMRRDYAGNVRELKSTVERAAMTAAGDVVTPTDLAFERLLTGQRHHPPAPSMPPAGAGPDLGRFKEAKRTLIDEFERDYLQRLLVRTGNNLSKASALAGVERHHLRDLFKKHGLRNDD
ncbi:MAG: sigma 54-interacting transcriptional regulator [Polyangiales bacterium]